MRPTERVVTHQLLCCTSRYWTVNKPPDGIPRNMRMDRYMQVLAFELIYFRIPVLLACLPLFSLICLSSRYLSFSILLLTMFLFFSEISGSLTGCCTAGNFERGLWHGQGTLRLASGEVYCGIFQQGLRHGAGDQVSS